MATLRLLFLVAVLFCCSCRCQNFGNLDCTTWEARRYRDCTCGVQYRDIEKHCQDDYTYFKPLLRYETLECEFECQNGGIKHVLDPVAEIYLCDCRGRGFGECCQKGKNTKKINAYQLIQHVHGLLHLLAYCVILETPCGELFLTPEGVLRSPNFPNPYPRNRRCVWQITTDPGKRIALGVKDGQFSVEEGSSIYTCDTDYIAVYDGNNKTSRRIGPFCGNTSRPFRTIHSTGRHLYIEFQSNNQVQYSGFELKYTTYRTGTYP